MSPSIYHVCVLFEALRLVVKVNPVKRALCIVILLLFFCNLQVSVETDNPLNGLLTKIGLASRKQAARGINRCFAAFFSFLWPTK